MERDGLNTNIGENGIMLSGGQKQRIGIARALYNNPEILILDEATSSLDYELEEDIMNEVYNISKGKTIIIVAHRLESLKKCNKLFKFIDGQLISSNINSNY